MGKILKKINIKVTKEIKGWIDCGTMQSAGFEKSSRAL